MTPRLPIVVAGAGSIGCFVGGLLAAAGHPVSLLARPRIIDEITAHGLQVTDFNGLDHKVDASRITLTDDPAILEQGTVILVTVKTGDTAAMAHEIARHAAKDAVVVSLQNGMTASDTLRQALPGFDIRAGMVPFNVVPGGSGCYHRATSGDIVIEAGQGEIGTQLTTPDLVFSESADMPAVQWGKLLINLNNALNALSGMTLHKQLLSRPWRLIMADQMAEALAVLDAHGIKTTSTAPLPSRLIPWVLRLPTPLFSRVAAKMLTIDPTARTSMSYDLEGGKRTEIDALQGLIIEMGLEKSIPTPLCRKVAQEIKQAEAEGAGLPNFSPSSFS